MSLKPTNRRFKVPAKINRKNTSNSSYVSVTNEKQFFSILVKNEIMESNVEHSTIILHNDTSSINARYDALSKTFIISCSFCMEDSALMYIAFEIPPQEKNTLKLFIPDLSQVFLLFSSLCTYNNKRYNFTLSRYNGRFVNYHSTEVSTENTQEIFNKFFSLLPNDVQKQYSSFYRISIGAYASIDIARKVSDCLNQLESIYNLSKIETFDEYTRLKLRIKRSQTNRTRN